MLLYPDLKQLGKHNWGHECVRMLRPDYVSLYFRKAAVGRGEGEAWHRPSLDFMGEGRKKGRQECTAGAWTPLTGAAPPSPCELQVWKWEAP